MTKFNEALLALQEIKAKIDNNYGELKDTDEPRLNDAEEQVKALLGWAVRHMMDCEAIAGAAKVRADEYMQRAKRQMASAEKFKNMAEICARAIGDKKITTEDATVYFSKGRQKIEIVDEAVIPDAFYKTVRSIDKTAINEFVKAGGVIDGVEVYEGAEVFNVRI